MRILFVIPSYQPAVVYGGTTVVVAKLAEELVKLGNEVSVYTTTANGKEELAVQPNATQVLNGVRVTYFKRITKDHTHFSPAMLSQLRKSAKDFDIIHLHSWWNLFNITAAWTLYKKGIKYIISPHGMLSPYTFQQSSKVKKLLHQLVGRKLLENTVLHGTSKQEINEIQTIVPSAKYFIASNLVELPELKAESEKLKAESLELKAESLELKAESLELKAESEELKAESEELKAESEELKAESEELKAESEKLKAQTLRPKAEEQKLDANDHSTQYAIHNTLTAERQTPNATPFTIGFLSRIEKKKNLELLFRVLAELDVEFTLQIAGDGETAYVLSLKQLAKDLKIEEKVSWLGWLQENKYDFLAELDLMVLPSYNENFAVVVLEALSVGTPVLVSNTVGLADYVAQEDLGWVFDGSDTDLKQQLLQVLKENEKRASIQNHAPALVRKHFESVTLAQTYHHYYQQLSDSHTSGNR